LRSQAIRTGDVRPDSNEKSLSAFVSNFCAKKQEITVDAGDINRDPMIQPNVYWTLEAPFVTIIGLYSNVPDGGEIKEDQSPRPRLPRPRLPRPRLPRPRLPRPRLPRPSRRWIRRWWPRWRWWLLISGSNNQMSIDGREYPSNLHSTLLFFRKQKVNLRSL
jgi:hypothetical protein